MQLVPGRQGFAREELHAFDSLPESPQGRRPVCTVGVIVHRLDNEANTLGLTQRQRICWCEDAV
jgi:hypothetical protein